MTPKDDPVLVQSGFKIRPLRDGGGKSSLRRRPPPLRPFLADPLLSQQLQELARTQAAMEEAIIAGLQVQAGIWHAAGPWKGLFDENEAKARQTFEEVKGGAFEAFAAPLRASKCNGRATRCLLEAVFLQLWHGLTTGVMAQARHVEGPERALEVDKPWRMDCGPGCGSGGAVGAARVYCVAGWVRLAGKWEDGNGKDLPGRGRPAFGRAAFAFVLDRTKEEDSGSGLCDLHGLHRQAGAESD
eukprot:s2308_g8.t1